MNVRKDKGLPDLRIGDLVEITVNDQNLLVDVHKAGEISHHRIVRGQLAVTLGTGHETAVIRTAEGKEESHGIRPVARSKVSSLPVGAEVTFLLDELDTIVDVTLGTPHRAGQSTTQGHKPVSYTHLRAHETVLDLVCRLLLEKKHQKKKKKQNKIQMQETSIRMLSSTQR